MSKVFKIRKGKDIALDGKPDRQILEAYIGTTVAIKPSDFKGLTPKLEIQPGDEVKAGDALFHHKNNPDIKFTSPVSGEIAEVVRGDRRALLEIRILADKDIKYKQFDVDASDPSAIKSALLQAGLWPLIIQRPFGTIASPDDTPKAIHISTFDSAPLAADLSLVVEGDEDHFKKGLEVLSRLTNGKLHLNHSARLNNPKAFTEAGGVQHNYFDGPHPAGLTGIQIHHIDPINKGDVVWTTSVQAAIFIGRFFNTGRVDLQKLVALGGSELSQTGYIKTITGSQIEGAVNNRLKQSNVRVISGNVLTGTSIGANGYLGFYDNMVSVIPEGDEVEFLGWLLPHYPRPTNSNSLPISKFLKKSFRANTNMHGEERAFVVTGQYEKVLPMDVMPVHLLKAILANDLESMENLGIYEVIEEDMALCEFVCTSKIEVQQIVREGLELMEEEG